MKNLISKSGRSGRSFISVRGEGLDKHGLGCDGQGPSPGDDGVEAVLVVGGVGHRPDGSVGLDDRVLALDDVPVALLPGRFRIARVSVNHAVVVRVPRIDLEIKNYMNLEVESDRSAAKVIERHFCLRGRARVYRKNCELSSNRFQSSSGNYVISFRDGHKYLHTSRQY